MFACLFRWLHFPFTQHPQLYLHKNSFQEILQWNSYYIQLSRHIPCLHSPFKTAKLFDSVGIPRESWTASTNNSDIRNIYTSRSEPHSTINVSLTGASGKVGNRKAYVKRRFYYWPYYKKSFSVYKGVVTTYLQIDVTLPLCTVVVRAQGTGY